MQVYDFASLQNDGSWLHHGFQAADDADAITFCLSVRTAALCELYEGEFLLATFDGAIFPAPLRRQLEPTC